MGGYRIKNCVPAVLHSLQHKFELNNFFFFNLNGFKMLSCGSYTGFQEES